MVGFSDGDLVWGPSANPGQNKTMWPAVIHQAIYSEDFTKCTIRFIKAEHNHLDDIHDSKEFLCDRSSLYLFDPMLATRFAPETTSHTRSVKRDQFDKVVALATQLFEERRKRVQEEYLLAVEKATKRASDYGADTDSSQPVELKAGAHIFFWVPGMIAGRPEAEMFARVLTVYHRSRYEESKIPLELDSGHVLTMDDSIRMLKPVETRLMPLRKFKLKTSSVTGVRMADIIRQSVQDHIDNLKAEDPAYAHLVRDVFGSSRQNVPVGKQEAKDGDFLLHAASRRHKHKKKFDSNPRKNVTPKHQDTPRDRAGWKPNCNDSEDDEDNRLKFVPQLSVPNRPESQASESPFTMKAALDPNPRKQKPDCDDSDIDSSQGDILKSGRQATPNRSVRAAKPLSAKSARPHNNLHDRDCHSTSSADAGLKRLQIAESAPYRLNLSSRFSHPNETSTEDNKYVSVNADEAKSLRNSGHSTSATNKKRRNNEISKSTKPMHQSAIKDYFAQKPSNLDETRLDRGLESRSLDFKKASTNSVIREQNELGSQIDSSRRDQAVLNLVSESDSDVVREKRIKSIPELRIRRRRGRSDPGMPEALKPISGITVLDDDYWII